MNNSSYLTLLLITIFYISSRQCSSDRNDGSVKYLIFKRPIVSGKVARSAHDFINGFFKTQKFRVSNRERGRSFDGSDNINNGNDYFIDALKTIYDDITALSNKTVMTDVEIKNYINHMDTVLRVIDEREQRNAIDYKEIFGIMKTMLISIRLDMIAKQNHRPIAPPPPTPPIIIVDKSPRRIVLPAWLEPSVYEVTRMWNNVMYMHNMKFEWHTARLFFDFFPTRDHLKAMHHAMHETVNRLCVVYNRTESDFERAVDNFKKDIFTMYVISNTIKYTLISRTVNTCGALRGTEAYVSTTVCGQDSFINTVRHEYAHYVDFKLSNLMYDSFKDRPYWWTEGLATYVSDTCYENFKAGELELRNMFENTDRRQNPYVVGSILHGFLDSTNELAEYHALLYETIRVKSRKYHVLQNEVIGKFGHTFKRGHYCKSYKRR